MNLGQLFCYSYLVQIIFLESFQILSVFDISFVIDIIPQVICETNITYSVFVTPDFYAGFTQIFVLGSDGIFSIGRTMEEWILTSKDSDSLAFLFKVKCSFYK